jgi:hypothetical protein
MIKSKKKLPQLPNLALEKEDELMLLMGDAGSATGTAFVGVRVGLYRPATKGTRAVLLVLRSAKEAFQLAAPFRVALQLTTPSGVTDFRVYRDAVPEARVPGICLLFSAPSPIIASQWIGALSALPEQQQQPSSSSAGPPPSSPLSGSSVPPGMQAPGGSGAVMDGLSQPRFSRQPDSLISVIHGATWQRFP